MSVRVSPTERLRAEIDEVFASSGDLAEATEQVARLGAQLLLQTALEAEITMFLGRDRYQRAALTEDARPGMRNGSVGDPHDPVIEVGPLARIEQAEAIQRQVDVNSPRFLGGWTTWRRLAPALR